MKVLVTGATGAIGSALVAALRAAGCVVVTAARRAAGPGSLQVDFAAPPGREWWAANLVGVDAVVNAAGILRESGADRFDSVHTQGPIELFYGCRAAGVGHVVQLSALGADAGAQTPFHRSKKAADDALRALGIPATIVQPSLVYGPGVASARLFDALALLPCVPLPRGGASRVQPVALEDVVEGLAALAQGRPDGTRTIAFVGPEPLRLRDYLALLRARLDAGGRQWVVSVPAPLALAGARLVGAFPRSPFTADAIAMLLRGNTAPVQGFAQLLGRMPRSLARPGSDRARRQGLVLSLWLAPLRLVVALLWIWTGLVSLGLYPKADSLALLADVGVTGALAPWALCAGAVLDLALGIAVLATRGSARRWVWAAHLATMAAYTAILSLAAPHWWLHPFGPLSKNLPVAALIALLWSLEPRTGSPRPGR